MNGLQYAACIAPIELVGGTLSAVVPLHTTNILFLLGGGRSPLYPPNKVILWDDALGKEVAELEFRERVRGIACRRGWLAVALRRRVSVFQVGETVKRYGEWDTCDNPNGVQVLFSLPIVTRSKLEVRSSGNVHSTSLDTTGDRGTPDWACAVDTSPSVRCAQT